MNLNLNPRDASALVALSSRDQSAALSLFNGLSTPRQAALVAAASPFDKKELLFLARDLSTLFEELHGRDVYLALESATASEFDVLVERIGPRHLNFLLAMGCWSKGEIDDARLLSWLGILNNCDASVALAAIADIEADFLVAALSPHFEVQSDESVEPEDNRGMSEAYSFTPDHCRFDNEAVEDFMERLFSADKTLFALICYKRVFGNPDEIFESARLSYSRRLQNEGLPSYEEAVAVYEKGWDILHDADIARFSRTKGVERSDPSALFFTRALGVLSTSGHGDRRLAGDFSSLLQKIAVADGRGMDDDSRRRAVRKAEIFISLGLEQASKGDVVVAAALLSQNGATPFFKAGHDMVSLLAKKAGDVLERSIDNEVNDADLPDRAVLQNAAQEIPRITLEDGKGRMVRTLAEFEAVRRKVLNLDAPGKKPRS